MSVREKNTVCGNQNKLKKWLLLFIFALITAKVFGQSEFLSNSPLFEKAFRKHSAVMLIIEPQSGEIIDANHAALDFYGLTYSQIRNTSIQQINLLNATQVANERLAAQTENRNYFIFRHRAANQTIKTVQVHSSPMQISGRLFLLSIVRDISSERVVQEQLWRYQTNLEQMVDEQVMLLNKQSEQRSFNQMVAIVVLMIFSLSLLYLLRRKTLAEQKIKMLSQIVEQSPVAIAMFDEHGDITYGNKQFENQQLNRKNGISSENSNFTISYLKLNDDVNNITHQVEQGRNWRGELLSTSVSGKESWEMSNVFSLSTQVDTSKYVFISQDITHIKEHEKQLRLASTVFHTATEAVMICDSSNKILAINQAFTDITGYEESEVIGEKPDILKSGHHDKYFYQDMYADIENTGTWQGEIINRRKNGEVYYEWLSITALMSPLGHLEAYVSLFSDITKRKKAEDKIYHQANFDTLTGLPNRHLFTDRLTQSLKVAERESRYLALLFIDLDGFKQVNDNLGHSQGDVLLQQVSIRLNELLRESDMVTRLGGDEFAIILDSIPDIYAIEKVASKIIEKIDHPFELGNQRGYVTASIGISTFPNDGNSVEELLKKADNAMYKAKASGRNNYQFFTQEMDEEAHRRSALEADLRAAIYDEQLDVWFQPIHDCKERKIKFAEALIRWNHHEKGMINPAEFVSLAEEIGVINQLGRFVLERACIEAYKWNEAFNCRVGVSVNVSSIQFQQHNFYQQVVKILLQTHLSPELLHLEITESLLIADDEQVYNQLIKLSDLGIVLSLDDFGTGYSSLSYLKRFPMDKLKIDRSFISDMNETNQDTRLIEAILSIAKSLQIETVAEGVEDKFQQSVIEQLGCDYIQGYFYSKPLPIGAFMAYLKDHIG